MPAWLAAHTDTTEPGFIIKSMLESSRLADIIIPYLPASRRSTCYVKTGHHKRE
ncbi:hypothetical protein M5E02_09395 [Bacillus safensis]|uniref:hypothetical protein n=1 Tax=Bacillus safensis TaxID=561879 RepID=UPI002074EE64|nr:hypothetical protein [Bacillus safensis]USD84596.1 hypothetical protein M5E02_09395 [Bacillus safensis]